MDRRRLALLLFVYVTLDFGNPLMPGAVQFDGESVDVVQADRVRPQAAYVTVQVAAAREPVADLLAQIQTGRLPRLRALPPRDQIAPRIWHTPLSSSDLPSSSEDH